MTAGPETRPVDPRGLAASLAGVLEEACSGRLGSITWFRADWQRGGAATGTASWRLDDGSTAEVVVKLPVVPRELTWISRLQADGAEGPPVAPRLYASGRSLGGYDLAWVVIERFSHGPLGMRWHEDHAARLADAAARFYLAASRYPVDRPARAESWPDLIKDAQQSLKDNVVPRQQAWRTALKALRGRLGPILAAWEARDAGQWLHGDLHLANAMSRESLESGPVSLIDFAEVRPGHWIEDAVYLERQLWTRPQRLAAARPVKAIADARRARGLPVEDDYARLAMIRRALLAASAPKYLKTEGDPRRLEACLDWLGKALAALR